MQCLTFSFGVFLWIIFPGLCGALVTLIQNPFGIPPATASETVHEALVKAEIIPDGEYIPGRSLFIVSLFNE